MKFDEIEMQGKSKQLWDIAFPKTKSWVAGRSKEKCLLVTGSEGVGKSLSLWSNARGAVKSWLVANPPPNEIGAIVGPFYCKRFKDWFRFEFCPTPDGKRSWNFDLLHEMTASNGIFFDDFTLNVNREAIQPLQEFIELLVDELTVMKDPPPLYMTSNNSADDWRLILGDQLVDRIGGPEKGICDSIRCIWESYR